MQFKGPIKHSLFISEILISFFSSFYKSLYQNLYIEGMIRISEDLTSTTNPLSNSTIILKR